MFVSHELIETAARCCGAGWSCGAASWRPKWPRWRATGSSCSGTAGARCGEQGGQDWAHVQPVHLPNCVPLCSLPTPADARWLHAGLGPSRPAAFHLPPNAQVEVLGQQAALLQLQLASGQQAAGELQGAVAAAAEEQAAAKSAADGLLGRKTAAGKEAKQAERGRVRLAQAAAESRLQAARLKVQLKAAEAAAAGGGGKARAGLQGKLSKAEEEAAEHRCAALLVAGSPAHNACRGLEDRS